MYTADCEPCRGSGNTIAKFEVGNHITFTEKARPRVPKVLIDHTHNYEIVAISGNAIAIWPVTWAKEIPELEPYASVIQEEKPGFWVVPELDDFEWKGY